jgi:Protein required for attachment to host cells
MSRIRILVADQAQAIFYDAPSLRAVPREVGRISDPAAHLHSRDLESDRPGRSYESFGRDSCWRTRARVVHEIRRDLVHSPLDALRRHLPASAAELRPG